MSLFYLFSRPVWLATKVLTRVLSSLSSEPIALPPAHSIELCALEEIKHPVMPKTKNNMIIDFIKIDPITPITKFRKDRNTSQVYLIIRLSSSKGTWGMVSRIVISGS